MFISESAASNRKVFPSTKKFRYNRIMPELEKKLDIMFGRIVATGADIWVLNSGVLPPELRDVEEVASSKEEHQDDEANTLHTDILDDPIIDKVVHLSSEFFKRLGRNLDLSVNASFCVNESKGLNVNVRVGVRVCGINGSFSVDSDEMWKPLESSAVASLSVKVSASQIWPISSQTIRASIELKKVSALRI
ncbi:hypothetical protein IEQ34_007300 [Dendrobium chrysotoxum]|uniref:Uncharacterized protein n=1 Tax=Dendrobium chrysotoxum TaxID=161865 RepID=A0AAV7H8S1_DENCH|nr:hypothetical protein IEQ34_007300 [Dendrobium chrysotoxum]